VIGLLMKSVAPASKAASIEAVSSMPVTIRIGSSSPPRRRSSRHTA
jgi:hypothetical protein